MPSSTITPALIAGAFAGRVRFRGYCLFITPLEECIRIRTEERGREAI